MVKRLFTLIVLLGSMLAASATVRGDVNGDGVVDIDDLNAVINVMLHKNADTGLEARADIDGNGMVDIDDLNVVINVMVGKDNGGSHDQGDWVDLGLPGGTLWATRNIGADKPEDYGDYFAWGETTPKAEYHSGTYKWWEKYQDASGNWHKGFTKYCSRSYEGLDNFVDDKTELDLADDAASVNWGGKARIPSIEQIQELVNTCTWQWTQHNGVNGQLATGPNGNTIFFPAAGERWDGPLLNAGYLGYYLSRTLVPYSPDSAYCLNFGSAGVDCEGTILGRFGGFSVRAVRVP